MDCAPAPSNFTSDVRAQFHAAHGSANPRTTAALVPEVERAERSGRSSYYDAEGVTLYLGDCLEVLRDMPKVDAVITDPPYNVGLQYGAGVDDAKANYAQWCAMWFGMLNADRIAISVGVANMTMWDAMKPPTWWLCWHKPAAMGRCVVGFNNWEPVGLWGKPLRATNDVISAPVVTDATVQGHPCPKPILWARKQIEMLVPEGGTVLDPFAGSGTVLAAARETGRRAIGIEINEAFCKLAVSRFGQGFLSLGGGGAERQGELLSTRSGAGSQTHVIPEK